MKRILSITLVFMVLASGLHVTVASHYCGGRLAQVRWSLNHALASCGMEEEGEKHAEGLEWHASCCSDVVSTWSTDGQFDVSTPMVAQLVLHASVSWFIVPENAHANKPQRPTLSDVFPPGLVQPSRVERPLLCVYRI